MIIDIHTHVGEYNKHWSERFAKIIGDAYALEVHDYEKMFSIDSEKFIKDMDEAGSNKVVIHAFDISNIDPGTKTDDEYIYNNYLKKYPDRLIGFSCVSPMDTIDRFSSENLKKFERSITELGFKGMKLLPTYLRYSPNHKSMYPFYQKAVELDVPVLIHTGATLFSPTMLEHSDIAYLEDVAVDFPELKICAAHMAIPWTIHLFSLMRKCRNVYTDISALCTRPMELAWNLVLAKEYKLVGRVMWGTDYPVCNPKNYVNWIRGELNKTLEKCGWPTFSNQEINQILGENACEFLGLKT